MYIQYTYNICCINTYIQTGEPKQWPFQLRNLIHWMPIYIYIQMHEKQLARKKGERTTEGAWMSALVLLLYSCFVIVPAWTSPHSSPIQKSHQFNHQQYLIKLMHQSQVINSSSGYKLEKVTSLRAKTHKYFRMRISVTISSRASQCECR